MAIEHERHAERGRFVTDDGSSELTYRRLDEKTVVFDHTFVPPERRGDGVAARLVAAGVEWARCENLRIVPECPYVERLFRRDPEAYADVSA